MKDYVSASIRAYIAVDRRRAVEDLLPHRLAKAPVPEAYFLHYARKLRELFNPSGIDARLAVGDDQLGFAAGRRHLEATRAVICSARLA
jgi:hypothetical protein